MAHENIRAQLRRDEAVDALARAERLPVHFCKISRVSYQPQVLHAPPHLAYAATFRKGDYIHIKEDYDESWWIGRIVGHESQMFFMPREAKLKSIIAVTSDIDQEYVYEDAPIMRPIVFLGPTKCDSKLSKLLQAPLLAFMKDKFEGRLITEESSARFGHDAMDVNDAVVKHLEETVFQAGSSLDLVNLKCLANSASDLNCVPKLHPLYVYVQVARLKVLNKLISQTATTSKEKGELLDCANQLSKNSHCCDLILAESNLEDACQQLELFLESYWASTRSVMSP